MENSLNYKLNELKKMRKLSQDDYDLVKCTDSRCPVLFCNPKVHKEEICSRPIISITNSYNSKLAKYFTSLLKNTQLKSKSYIKASFLFPKIIQQ